MAEPWTDVDGALIEDGSGNPLECDVCPCVEGHESTCNEIDNVPDTLDFTINYGVHTLPVSLTWASDACTGATEGWAYDGPDAEICEGFDLREVSLCCDGETWSLTVVVVVNGNQDALITPSFFAALTINSTNPVDYSTTSHGELSTPCGFEFVLIDITAP